MQEAIWTWRPEKTSTCTATEAKKTVSSSVASRLHKYRRQNCNPLQGPESISGPSHQQRMRQSSPPKEESRRGARVQSDKARETRTTRSKRHSAALRENQSGLERRQQ
ncbi:hypothetical protein TNCV_846711 [Trichonephila clavipes]|nr:hypothetical protein TNCV_846711 [Trichonephila clavipes]